MRNPKHTTRTRLTILMALGLAFASHAVQAATPQELQRDYAAAAQREAPAFKANAQRGEQFFRSERTGSKGGQANAVACATCHTADPRNRGLTRANKAIEPLAPAANAARFTDPAKVEKWFGRNCDDVLSRACTAAEKADFIAWLASIK